MTLYSHSVPALGAEFLGFNRARSTVLPTAFRALVSTARRARLQALLDAVDVTVRDRMAQHLTDVTAVQLGVALQPAASVRTLREVTRGPRLHSEVFMLLALQRKVI